MADEIWKSLWGLWSPKPELQHNTQQWTLQYMLLFESQELPYCDDSINCNTFCSIALTGGPLTEKLIRMAALTQQMQIELGQCGSYLGNRGLLKIWCTKRQNKSEPSDQVILLNKPDKVLLQENWIKQKAEISDIWEFKTLRNRKTFRKEYHVRSSPLRIGFYSSYWQ